MPNGQSEMKFICAPAQHVSGGLLVVMIAISLRLTRERGHGCPRDVMGQLANRTKVSCIKSLAAAAHCCISCWVRKVFMSTSYLSADACGIATQDTRQTKGLVRYSKVTNCDPLSIQSLTCLEEIGERFGPINLAMLPIWRGATLSFIARMGLRVSSHHYSQQE